MYRSMKLIGYGEDALTFWALTHRLRDILNKFGDNTLQESCTVFFRPSFGRHGGLRSSEFGEFDFILITDQAVYLGESKWHRSSEEIVDGKLQLRPEQIERHKIMAWYIEEWTKGNFDNWSDFFNKKGGKIRKGEFLKPLPPIGSLLSENLINLLEELRHRFKGQSARIYNVLVYFHAGDDEKVLPKGSNGNFTIVNLDYSPDRIGNFIKMS